MDFHAANIQLLSELFAFHLLLTILLISAIPALVVAWNLGYAELVEVTRMPFTAGRFAITVLGTFILIAGMIVIGIGYPARRAMSIEPAEALHEE